MPRRGTVYARLDSKGRITIPLEARTRLGLREGDRLRIIIDEEAGRIILEKAGSTAERFYGVLRPRRPLRSIDEEAEEAVYEAGLGDTST